MSNIYSQKYTEKSIVVRGETKEFKESLKSLGGKWNSKLTDKSTQETFGGWIFPLSKTSEVEKWMRNKVTVLPSQSPKSVEPKDNFDRIAQIETMLVEVIKELEKLDKSFVDKINNTEFYKTFVNKHKVDCEEFEEDSGDEESGPLPKRLLGKNIM